MIRTVSLRRYANPTWYRFIMLKIRAMEKEVKAIKKEVKAMGGKRKNVSRRTTGPGRKACR